MADLVESMKRAALEAVANSDPSCIMYGKVISEAPLQIQVNVKLILEEAQLVLTRNVTDFKTEVTVDWLTEESLGPHKHDAGSLTDGEGRSVSGETGETDLTHTHPITGRKEIIVHNALKAGEEVILIRQSGGQEYIVLDRAG